MTEVWLGFKAFDAHELLCHFVAHEAGLYKKFGVQVKLQDTNFVADKQLPSPLFQVACGAALSSWFQGAAVKVVFVATEKPLFWLYSRPGVKHLSDLAGLRIASYPSIAPPAIFLQALFSQRLFDDAGLTTCPPQTEAARDDVARLGLLMSGDVGAAVMSSAISQAWLVKKGFRQLLFFGDHLRIPTTGLAVTEALIQAEPELVALMVKIHQQSLQLIGTDQALVQAVLVKYFSISEAFVKADSNIYRTNFCDTGLASSETIESAVSLMARQLGIDLKNSPERSLYDFRYLARMRV